MNRYLTTIAATTMLVLFSGCLGHLRGRHLSHRDYGHGGVVHADYLEPACDSCPTHAPHAASSCDSGSCATGNCDRCDGGTAMPVGALHGLPLAHRIKQRLACGDGCGEVYIGEWISTPPTPDPCDYSGNYTGAANDMIYREHAQPVRTTLRRLAGIRFLGTRYADPSIGSDTWGDQVVPVDGSYEDWSPEMMGEPTADIPTATIRTSRPQGVPYRPISTHSPTCNCGH